MTPRISPAALILASTAAFAVSSLGSDRTQIPFSVPRSLGSVSQAIQDSHALSLPHYPAPFAELRRADWSPAGVRLGFLFADRFYAEAPDGSACVFIYPDPPPSKYFFDTFWWAGETEIVLREMSYSTQTDLECYRYVLVDLDTGERVQTVTPRDGGFVQVVGARSRDRWYVDLGHVGDAVHDLREFDPFTCSLSGRNLIPKDVHCTGLWQAEAVSPWLVFLNIPVTGKSELPPPYSAGAFNADTAEEYAGTVPTKLYKLLFSPQRATFYGSVCREGQYGPGVFDLVSGQCGRQAGDSCADCYTLSSARDRMVVGLVNGEGFDYSLEFVEVPLGHFDH